MINIYRLKNGLVHWGPISTSFAYKYDPKIIASCPTWEAAKSAVRLLSMGEEYDGRFNLNGKLVPLTEEQYRRYYKNEI